MRRTTSSDAARKRNDTPENKATLNACSIACNSFLSRGEDAYSASLLSLRMAVVWVLHPLAL